MPTLKITCCEDCPHSRTRNEYGLDDSYLVTCEHPEQKLEDEWYTHKMKNSQRVYFDCPLNTVSDDLELYSDEDLY